jgi:hypothetical protein
MEVDLSALAVIDELVSEMDKQGVDVFLASASTRVVKSLEAYDLLHVLGGLPLVTLDAEDVFHAAVEELGIDPAIDSRASTPNIGGRARSNSASLALAEHRAAQGGGLKKEGSGTVEDSKLPV